MRTELLDETGDPDAEPGSRPWAVYFFRHAKSLRRDLDMDVRLFAETLKKLEERHAWDALETSYAKLLSDLGLTEKEASAIRAANPGETLGAVLGKHGGDRKSKKADQVASSTLMTKGSTQSSYIIARLQRDAQTDEKAAEVYGRVAAKKLTPYGAAKEMDWVKKKTPLDQLQHWWVRATDEERAAFEEWAASRESQ